MPLLFYFVVLATAFLYGYTIYVIFTQVLTDPLLRRWDRTSWALLLVAIPFYGLWAWNYKRSRRKDKTIFRY